jgi:hypothetical protein
MQPEIPVTVMVPEPRLDKLGLLIEPVLRNVPDLRGGAGIGRACFDLNLARVGMSDRAVRLVRIRARQGARLEQLDPPRIKRLQTLVPLLLQPGSVRHRANVVIFRVNLVQEVVERAS